MDFNSSRRGSVSERYGSPPPSPNPPPPPPPQTKNPITATRGVKIQNVNATEKAKQEAEREQILNDFNENANKTIAYDSEIKQKTAQITQRFMSMAESKVLKRAKTNVNVSVENQIKQEVLALGMELNNNFDPRSPDAQFGIGSISIITMLMNVVLNQRERLNDLEFDYKELNRQFIDLKKALGE